jgi:DNA-binding NarL/FixJ family response regulator
MTPRFLIVDDHPLTRGGVIGQLTAGEAVARFEQADSLAEALRILTAAPRIDVVLLDLNLPDTVGTSGIETLRQRFPRVPVLVLSADAERATIDRCLRAGACGFVAKTASADRIGAAVRAVAAGGIYVPRDADGGAIRPWGLRPPAAQTASDVRELGLTDRQSDVLRLIMRGLPNKLIGRQLQLAEGTVKVHVSAVLRALGVRNRSQAILAASRLGLRID